MLDMVLEGIYIICVMLCMVFVGERTYHWTVRSWKKIMLSYTVFILGMILYFTVDLPYELLFYVFELVSWYILCDAKLRDKFFKIIAWFFMIGAPEAIAMILIDMAGGYGLGEEIRKIIAILLTFLFFYIITERPWYANLVNYLEGVTWFKTISLFLIFIFCQILVVFANFVRDNLENRDMVDFFRISFAMELCTVIGIILWLVRETYQKKYYLEQNSLKEEYIRTQQEYYQTIYEKDKEIRSFRHDVANQICLLQMMLEQNDVEGAKEHLNHISQNFAQTSFRRVYVGNEILDAILSMMCKKASDKGVQIEIEGELQDYNAQDSYELCGILSNAISNAVEACEKTSEEKKVTVKLTNHNQTLYLKIQNSASEEMYQAIVKEKTTKADSDNHGYGVRNIKHAVERLHGSMEYNYMDGRISLEIYI